VAKKSKTVRKKALDDQIRVLVLHGSEHYLLHENVQRLKDNIEEKRGCEVEILRFPGASSIPADVFDEARSYGLMMQYKVVIIDEASEFLGIAENRRATERYAERPAQDATLVLRSHIWRPGNIDKIVKKVGLVMKCESPDRSGCIRFCKGRCAKRYDCKVDENAAALLVDRIGCKLAKLDIELARLSVMANEEGVITSDLVKDQVQLSREEKAWIIQQAILSGQPEHIIQTIRELFTISKQPAILVNFAMTGLAKKLFITSRMQQEHVNESEIDDYLGRWDRGRHDIKRVAQLCTPSHWASIVNDCMSIDKRSKSGYGDAERNIELLAMRFLSVNSTTRR